MHSCYRCGSFVETTSCYLGLLPIFMAMYSVIYDNTGFSHIIWSLRYQCGIIRLYVYPFSWPLSTRLLSSFMMHMLLYRCDAKDSVLWLCQLHGIVTAQVRELRLWAGNLYPYRIVSHTYADGNVDWSPTRLCRWGVWRLGVNGSI